MTDTQVDDQQSEGGALRAQLEAALAENKTLREENTGYKRRDAFSEAGIDISTGPGKLLAQTYDGEFEPEAIKSFAKEYGIEPGQPTQDSSQQVVQQQVTETQQRMDALRQNSQPDGIGQRVSHTDYLKLNSTDPAAARQLWEAGQVDVPPHIASALADNGRGN
jgi:hypothetical protein